MFSRIGMMLLVVTFPTDIHCDLCDFDTIHYRIGQNVTILDISSEEISVLTASCIKQILIPDSLYALVYVEKADFGGNQGFEYSDQGLTPKISRDSAFLTKQCTISSPETEKDIAIVKGLLSYVRKDTVCIRLVPELKLRSLGYRVRGGRLKLIIQVIFAVCNRNNTNAVVMPRTIKPDSCRPICSVRGVESLCEETQTASVVTTERTLTPNTSIKGFTNTPQETTTTDPRRLTAVVNTSTAWKNTPASQTSSKRTSAIPFVDERQPTYFGTFSTDSYIHVSTRSVSTKRSYSLNQWATSIEKYRDNNTDHANKTRHGQYETIVDNMMQTSSDATSSKTFGLLEGLCVLVGCLVLFVVFATIKFLYGRNKAKVNVGGPLGKHGSKFSDSSYISRWRDNWFLRYHGNEQSDVSDCLSESEIKLQRGCPHHTSYDDSETWTNEDKIQASELSNPLPLVRLSSDFVQNTKSLEVSSDKCSDICENLVEKTKVEKKTSKASSDSGMGKYVLTEAQTKVCPKSKSKSLKENSGSSMKERLCRVKRVNSQLRSHGSYNVSKAQRSASLSNN